MKYLHINCDLGEGGLNDAELMPLISSSNIACGGHAGNSVTMTQAVMLALENKVEIGAHPSYPDKENFGRKRMKMTLDILLDSLVSQIETLRNITEAQGGKLKHIKAHGALYNDAAKDEEIAGIVLKAALKFGENIAIYAPQNSILERVAKGKIEVITEAFADRNYEDNFQLVSRQNSNAVLTEKEKVFEHLFLMFLKNKIVTVNGKKLDFKADTFCLHSDTKNSVEILKYLHQKFAEIDVMIYKS